MGKQYFRIDGQTPSEKRQSDITSFNDPTQNAKLNLYLIMTKAGGVGINLQAANRVVLLDTSWNPATDLQAIHRCYRYGQTKQVFVYRMLSEGTMEEKIYARSANKESLASRVIDENNPENHFSNTELENCLKHAGE